MGILAYLLLGTGSWAQRICRGSCQQCRRGAALWLELAHEGLQPEEHMAEVGRAQFNNYFGRWQLLNFTV